MVLLAEIGDIGRFRNARALASWAGLTPTVRGSDLTVRHGHISKQGSPYVRWVLGQAAHIAKRHPEFAGGYQDIAARRGSKIATVAVARKLLTRASHLLADTDTPRGGARQHGQFDRRWSAARWPAHRPGGSPSPGCARSSGMSRPPGRARASD